MGSYRIFADSSSLSTGGGRKVMWLNVGQATLHQVACGKKEGALMNETKPVMATRQCLFSSPAIPQKPPHELSHLSYRHPKLNWANPRALKSGWHWRGGELSQCVHLTHMQNPSPPSSFYCYCKLGLVYAFKSRGRQLCPCLLFLRYLFCNPLFEDLLTYAIN